MIGEMNILAVTGPSLSISSIRPEAEILIGLHEGGDPVTVMTARDNVYWERFSAAGLALIEAVPRRRLDAGFMRLMRQTLRERAFDVVYLFNNKAICNTAFAALGLPPLLVTYRGQTGNIRRLDPGSWMTHLHPRIDAISCVADAVRDDLRPHVRRRVRTETIYKGHDLSWYDETPADLGEFGIPAEAFTVGCVANNRPRKGIPVLVDAMHRLPADAPIHLLLVGQGMESAGLASRIADGPAAGRIHTAGFRADATALVAACSCTVLPAIKREGLPKTVIESMAYRVPPILTDTGGSAELVEPGISGIVVPPGDAGAIAAAILHLWQHPDEAAAMGAAARQRLADHFSIAASIDQTRCFFAALHQYNPRRRQRGTAD